VNDSNPRRTLEPLHFGKLNADKLPGESKAANLTRFDAPPNRERVDVPTRGELVDGELRLTG